MSLSQETPSQALTPAEMPLRGIRTNIVQSIRAFRVQELQDAAVTLGQHFLNSCFDALGCCFLVQAKAQHHCGAQDGGQGVGHAFAGNVRRAAMAGFVQTLVAGVEGR